MYKLQNPIKAWIAGALAILGLLEGPRLAPNFGGSSSRSRAERSPATAAERLPRFKHFTQQLLGRQHTYDRQDPKVPWHRAILYLFEDENRLFSEMKMGGMIMDPSLQTALARTAFERDYSYLDAIHLVSQKGAPEESALKIRVARTSIPDRFEIERLKSNGEAFRVSDLGGREVKALETQYVHDAIRREGLDPDHLPSNVKVDLMAWTLRRKAASKVTSLQLTLRDHVAQRYFEEEIKRPGTFDHDLDRLLVAKATATSDAVHQFVITRDTGRPAYEMKTNEFFANAMVTLQLHFDRPLAYDLPMEMQRRSLGTGRVPLPFELRIRRGITTKDAFSILTDYEDQRQIDFETIWKRERAEIAVNQQTMDKRNAYLAGRPSCELTRLADLTNAVEGRAKKAVPIPDGMVSYLYLKAFEAAETGLAPAAVVEMSSSPETMKKLLGVEPDFIGPIFGFHGEEKLLALEVGSARWKSAKEYLRLRLIEAKLSRSGRLYPAQEARPDQ